MHAAGEITNGPETWNNLSPFSRDFDHMGKTGLNWQDILMDADIRINYAGNVHDMAHKKQTFRAGYLEL